MPYLKKELYEKAMKVLNRRRKIVAKAKKKKMKVWEYGVNRTHALSEE
tara:strand:- start:968 stop:1111 length:144 start_codon:yes stop_codon:yes gene_type:complete